MDLSIGRTLCVDEVSRSTRELLILVAKNLLSGVGETPSALEQMTVAIHYRRSLAPDELAILSPAWCAIPATSLAGHGILLERDDAPAPMV